MYLTLICGGKKNLLMLSTDRVRYNLQATQQLLSPSPLCEISIYSPQCRIRFIINAFELCEAEHLAEWSSVAP